MTGLEKTVDKRCECGNIIWREEWGVKQDHHVCRDCQDTLCESCCNARKGKAISPPVELLLNRRQEAALDLMLQLESMMWCGAGDPTFPPRKLTLRERMLARFENFWIPFWRCITRPFHKIGPCNCDEDIFGD